MTIDLIIFFGLALVVVASALGLLFSRNAVYCALFLILNFSTVALFYLILDAPFITLTQISIYAGAIMVLFLFVIMLLGAEQIGQTPTIKWQQPIAITLGAILLIETVYVLVIYQSKLPSAIKTSLTFGSPHEVGILLFDKYLLPFEITSVLLLTAMIGAIVLTKRKTS